MTDKNAITAETFDKYANRYHQKYFDWDFYHDTYNDLLEFIEDGANVFEFACGPGNICKYLTNHRKDLNYTGIDVSPNMIKIAKANNPNANFQVEDCRLFKSAVSNFDLVVAGFYIPYINQEEVVSFIQSASTMIRENGILYCSYAKGDYNESGQELSPEGDRLFMHYYSFEFMSTTLQQHCLQVLKHQTKNLPLKNGQYSQEDFIIARKQSNK